MSSALQAAKLRRPAVSDHYVDRRRLLDLLDEVTRAPLTLVIAPAGAGKTALLAGWVSESAVPSAWLSLDEADRLPVQFWSGVIAALETVAPGCGTTALAMLRGPRKFSMSVIDQLVDDLAEGERPPAVLVVDDFHTVADNEAIAASVAVFVRHQPGWLRLVLASRRRPSLPIDRMRSRGQLGEVDFDELQFSPDEATQLLTNFSPTLSANRVHELVDRAGGWAASLQLAALAERSAGARHDAAPVDLAKSLLVHDYVVDEALAGEAEPHMDVLFALSVVRRANVSLANALLQRPDAGDLLRDVEARGLFVAKLGPEGWYVLHDLVRDVLVVELELRAPGRLNELHLRAATWYEGSGETVLALEHWLQAQQHQEALRLLALRQAELYDSGREAAIKRTISAIPAALAASDPEARLAFAWLHLLVDRRRFLELVEELGYSIDEERADHTVRARLALLRSTAAVIGGRWDESAAMARRSIDELDEWWTDPLGRFGWNLLVRPLALSERWDDNDDVVRRAEVELQRDPERRLSFEGARACGTALAGRPIDALRIAAGVRHAATVPNMSILRTELAVAEALANRELGDRPRAVAELEALADTQAEAMLYCRVLAMVELSHAQLDVGDLDEARRWFGEAQDVIEAERFGSDVRNWLARLATRLSVADGDLSVARHWAEQIDDPFWRGISVARVELAAGDRAAAAAALEPTVSRCARHRVIAGLLRARASVDGDEAVKHATSAIELAVENGMLQTVASEGPEAVELATSSGWRAPRAWLERLQRATAESRVRPIPIRPALTEPLTERERDVLRFLPSRLTVREIADELYVSVNTLKFHLKVIYRKLGVSSRAEAADVARKLMSVRR